MLWTVFTQSLALTNSILDLFYCNLEYTYLRFQSYEIIYRLQKVKERKNVKLLNETTFKVDSYFFSAKVSKRCEISLLSLRKICCMQ